jgi:hypothetical protein
MQPDPPKNPVLQTVAALAKEKEGLLQVDGWPGLVQLVEADGLTNWQLCRLLSWLNPGTDDDAGREQARLAQIIHGLLTHTRVPPQPAPAQAVDGPIHVPELGETFADWATFVGLLIDRDDEANLKLLGEDLAAARSATGRQAKRFVDARLHELKFSTHSRMLRGHAMFGLELQDLDSMVAQLPTQPPDVPVAVVPSVLCGAKRHWQLTGDGSDLEFITGATNNAHVLDAVLAEIVAAHERMTSGGAGIYQAGGTCLFVAETTTAVPEPTANRQAVYRKVVPSKCGAWLSGGAQPQYNVDIPLDRLVGYLAGLDQLKPEFTELFGVDGWFWRAVDTKREMAAYSHAARRLKELEMSSDLDHLLGPVVTTEWSLRQHGVGYLLLLAICAIHVDGYFGSPTKDMPLLPKTNLGELRPALIGDNALCKLSSVDVVQELYRLKVIRTDYAKAIARIRPFVGRIDEGRHPFLDACPDLRGPRDVAGHDWDTVRPRYHIVFEYRRVPVLAAHEWLPAARRQFEYFIVDAAGNFS